MGMPGIEHNKTKGQFFPYICLLQWCLNKKIKKNQKSKIKSDFIHVAKVFNENPLKYQS